MKIRKSMALPILLAGIIRTGLVFGFLSLRLSAHAYPNVVYGGYCYGYGWNNHYWYDCIEAGTPDGHNYRIYSMGYLGGGWLINWSDIYAPGKALGGMECSTVPDY